MRTIEVVKTFRRDLKRERSGLLGKRLDALLTPVLEALANDKPLPGANQDHALAGEWSPARDCHIRPDLVLIYEKIPGVLRLLRLGSHSELFG